jgi:phage shock protein PspC (stress-responsive transcriptional regulator)
MEQPKRLTRSSSNRMLAGVAGGIAEYFNIDPTLVRIAFIVLAMLPGPSFLIYGVLWIVIPPDTAPFEKPKNDSVV